jgi:hypothetical protein
VVLGFANGSFGSLRICIMLVSLRAQCHCRELWDPGEPPGPGRSLKGAFDWYEGQADFAGEPSGPALDRPWKDDLVRAVHALCWRRGTCRTGLLWLTAGSAAAQSMISLPGGFPFLASSGAFSLSLSFSFLARGLLLDPYGLNLGRPSARNRCNRRRSYPSEGRLAAHAHLASHAAFAQIEDRSYPE